jgi:hypothetical protein
MTKKLASLLFVMSSLAVAQTDVIVTDSTSNSTVNSNSTSTNINETTVKSPPPSAISPSMNVFNNDLCTVGVSGAVQTQILGISGGSTVRDLNCERLKLSKNLFDMGLKVAAVSVLCQDHRVFSAMQNAGTPCPIDGKIGQDAQKIWDNAPERHPLSNKDSNEKSFFAKYAPYIGSALLLLLLL